MSLIFCEECGMKISSKASFCPHCGCPIMSSRGIIHFYWVGNKTDSLRKTTVYIDGNEVAIMKCGDCIDVPVDGGRHKVDLYQGKHHLVEDYVEINSNNPDAFYAYKESMGFSHAQLKRVNAKFPERKITKQNVPRCPTCGSEKIKKISTTKKVFSFEMVGFASGSIGKTFECSNCHYKW